MSRPKHEFQHSERSKHQLPRFQRLKRLFQVREVFDKRDDPDWTPVVGDDYTIVRLAPNFDR